MEFLGEVRESYLLVILLNILDKGISLYIYAAVKQRHLNGFRVVPYYQIKIKKQGICDGLVVVFLSVEGLCQHPDKGSSYTLIGACVEHDVVVGLLGIYIIQEKRAEYIRGVQEGIEHGV